MECEHQWMVIRPGINLERQCIICYRHESYAGEPFKAPSEEWYKGAEHGEQIGIEKGRKQIIEELKALLEIQ